MGQNVEVIKLRDNPEHQELLTGSPQTQGMRSGRVYLQPGQDCGRHSTGRHEEMLTFLAGRGRALIGEKQQPYDVGRDNIVYIPPETIHNIENTGTEPLVYIYCVAPISPSAGGQAGGEGRHH